MEIELKLLLDPGDVAAFRRHPLLRQHAIGKPVVQQLTSIYFDTPDCHFWQHDMTLRLRRVERDWVQTLKGGGNVTAGLHRRQEWETRVEGAQPDLAALIGLVGHGRYWRKVLPSPALAEKIAPIFTMQVRRTVWQLRLAHGDEVELALDQGEVQHDAAQVPISEVELELKSGDPARLFDFALQLQQAVPLRAGNVSKAERGYALVAPHPPMVVKAASLEFSQDVNVEQGFLVIVGNCLTQVQGNESGIVQGNDAESVHQMRVGLRRLRCAIGLFADVAPCPAALQTELEWLASELGATRDWEVMAGTTLQTVASARPDQTELAQLQQAAQALAEQSRQQAARAVASVRYARLLLSMGAWMQGRRWRESLTQLERQALQTPLPDLATQTLLLCHRKLKQRGKRMRESTASTEPQARHRVRIAAKKVRYATEFFQPLYPAKRVRPFIKTLTVLQDALGSLNDMTVADAMLRQLANSQPKLAHSAGFARGYLSVCAERDVRKLGKVWQQFRSMQPPCNK